jgi:hypothetical protein
MPNPQAGAPPLVGCPRLLIQYIRRYPPYLEAASSILVITQTKILVTYDLRIFTSHIYKKNNKGRLTYFLKYHYTELQNFALGAARTVTNPVADAPAKLLFLLNTMVKTQIY